MNQLEIDNVIHKVFRSLDRGAISESDARMMLRETTSSEEYFTPLEALSKPWTSIITL